MRKHLEETKWEDDCAITPFFLNGSRRDVLCRAHAAKGDAPRIKTPVLRQNWRGSSETEIIRNVAP